MLSTTSETNSRTTCFTASAQIRTFHTRFLSQNMPSQARPITAKFRGKVMFFLSCIKNCAFWRIVRNIPLPFSSFAHSQVVSGKTTGRYERPRGMPWEWVRKIAQFTAFVTKLRSARNANGRSPPQLRPDHSLRQRVRCGDYRERLLGSKFSCARGEHAHEHGHGGSCLLELARRVEPYCERIEPEGV